MTPRSYDDPPAAVRRLEDAVRLLARQTRGRARTGRSHQDADDAAGTVTTDDAIGFDPLPLLRALDEQDAHVIVIGQVAGIMHGSRELTGDLDLLWDGVPVGCDPAAFELPKVLFHSPAASGDCCTPALPWGDLPVADFIGRCETVTAMSGFKIRYLAREDLIRMRRAIGRPKDLRRADELERGAG